MADPPRPKPSKAPTTSTRKAPPSLKPFPPPAAVPTAGEPSKKERHGAPHLHRVHVPYIPATTNLPEVTVKAVVLGVILAVLLGAANTYLGLKAGLTVAASIPAAVMSLAVLKLFRKHNILENNMVQTIASAGTSVASGAIFTIPALILLGYWEDLNQHYWEVTMIIIIGGILGVLFSVPIRRALIVEENLPFPEGRATGEVLKAGERGGVGIGALILGGGLGALFKILQGGFRFFREETAAAVHWGKDSVLGLGFNLQPALMGVGVIIGLRIAVLVFLGGALGWFIGIPLYSTFATDLHDPDHGAIIAGQKLSLWQLAEESYSELPGTIWSFRIRYIGVGAMLVGGVWSLIKLRKPLTRAIAQGIRSARAGTAESRASIPRTERDLPFSMVGLGAIVLAVPMGLLYFGIAGDYLVALALSLIMLVTGFAFSAVGGYMAGLVGSSNTPISGVTILALLSACLALLAFGVTASVGPPLAVMVAAIIAVAGSISGDNLQDLKAGHMLGATPRKQQLLIIVGALASAFFIGPIIQTLIDGANPTEAYPLGKSGDGGLNAPQANLMYRLSSGLFSPAGLTDQLPMIIIGGVLAVALIVTDILLQRAGSTFRTPVMPVAVGIYLPVGLSVPIFVGGLASWVVDSYYAGKVRDAAERVKDGWRALGESGSRTGVLFASGLIAGEAILGIATAFRAAQTLPGEPPATFGFDAHLNHDWAGFVIMGYMVFLVWYLGVRPGMKAAREGGPPEGLKPSEGYGEDGHH